MTIVMAWVDEAGQRRAEIVNSQGTTQDFQMVLRDAIQSGRRVYTYQTTEADPLHRARQDLTYDIQYNSASYRRRRPLAS